MTTANKRSNIGNAVSGFRILLDLIIKQEQEMLDCINAEMKAMPKGTLYMYQKGSSRNTPSFSSIIDGTHRGITKDRNLVYKLARKKYLSICKRELECDVAVNTKVALELLAKQRSSKSGNKIRSLLEEYASAGLDIARITMTPEQYRWMHEPFDSNEMNPDELIYETFSGIRMRSKSERSIGNKLELYGIPYHYEQAVTLDVLWMDNEYGEALYSPKTYYPDFIIMTLSGDYVVWEHLGRVDLFRYRAHTMEKICAYRQNGDVDIRHLILTFERDLNNLDTLDDIICRQILPLGV